LINRSLHFFLLISVVLIGILCCGELRANPRRFFTPDNDTTRRDTTLRFPIQDRRGDPYSGNYRRNPFDLRDTAFVKQRVEYDPVTNQYYVTEKIGNQYYRKPAAIDFEEFVRLRGRELEMENFKSRADASFSLNRKLVRPKLRVFDDLFNRVFGNGKIEIRPNGNVDIMAGYTGQNVENPTLPERARRYGTFDFDMNAQFNMEANIGDKMKLPINFNTLANFDFENQLKLDYRGNADEIIKSIEAGNMSFATKGRLIQGSQALFGLKTQLQFGKLTVTGVLANQKSQRQTQNFQGGASVIQFSRKLDDYDENRHFLLAQYFRENYNEAMSQLPFVQSQVQIMRIEVWLTNRTGQTTDSRDVVGLMDLGERNPYNTNIPTSPGNNLPDNGANALYGIVNNENFRNPNTVSSQLQARGLRPVQDFERTFARKLVEGTDYTFNRQVGFISINQFIQPDEVLGVAFQYTLNGRVFQVGEFAQDVALDTAQQGVQKILFLKMLKATSQRPLLPIWKLMMKNVYALDLFNVERDGFRVNVTYEEPGGGEKRMLPEGDDPGRPLLRILQLDRLNGRNDPQPDGVFDFVDSFTVQPQFGRIIFPVLEPFGSDLKRLAFANQPDDVADKYVFQQLYDTIKMIAQQNYPHVNRFYVRGQAKGGTNDEVYLNAFNIPPGSVTVTAGGQVLKENVDYTIDYNLGKLVIINQAIKSSGVPISVNMENNIGFGIQNRGFMGIRADYVANKKLSIGGTLMQLGERPFFTKMNYGEDPIRNNMYGVDFNYMSEWKQMTRWLNKIPGFSSNAPSNIQAYGEAAMLRPGQPPQIGKGQEALIYLDDFEGTRANIDLRFPFIGWVHSSIPKDAGLAEAENINDISSGFNRARLAWYQIEPVMQDPRNPNNPIRDRNQLSDPRVRAISNQELFPQSTPPPGLNQLISLDLAYYPRERGVYNFDTRPGSVLPNGKLANPRTRWGGLMRAIDQTDFETANIEFVEFWVQDPFLRNAQFPNGYTNPAGGELFINLGNVSEDIMKDGRRFFENGLPSPSQPNLAVDSNTVWGRTPLNPIQVANAFSNNPEDRPFQDVGFDGLNDDDEKSRRLLDFLNPLQNILGAGSPAFQAASADPSNDNFVNYRNPDFDAINADILARYKRFNGPQGNSPVSVGSEFLEANSMLPDNEDLNRDNSLNEAEEYFEYKIDFRPASMVVGQNFITDRRTVSIRYENGTQGEETWYQFRIPVARYNRRVGDIPDFKSIRFMRMYLKGWEDSVVLRFARLDLVRNNWRQFAFELSRDGTFTSTDQNTFTTLNTLAVNIEENDRRVPIPYRIPPGIERVQALANGGVNILQNEQSISLQARNLLSGDARGVFRTYNNDLRRYRRLRMFIHAEELTPQDPGYTPIPDNYLYAVVRLGQDFMTNYYEVKVPLHITRPAGPNIPVDSIWPEVNNLDFFLQELIDLKNRRNAAPGTSPIQYYSDTIDGRIYGIFGNPNLGEIRGMFIGVENPPRPDGPNMGVEVWFNELRLSNIDDKPGYAAIGRVDMQLSDLGTLSVAGAHTSTNFGTIEQRIGERSTEATTQFDFSLQIDAAKLLPKTAGVSIPIYASSSRITRTPEFDPYDMDVLFKDKLKTCANCDSLRKYSRENLLTQTLNFNNVRLLPRQGKKPAFYRLSNFDLTYNYFRNQLTSPIVTEDLINRHRAVLGYQYGAQPKYIEPFKKLIKSKSPWLTWAKEFNFNLVPSSLAFRADISRQFGRYVPRIVNTFDNTVERVDSTYDKFFTQERFYYFRWDVMRSVNIDFTANNSSWVDEPYGELDTREKRDTMWRNFWSGGRNTLYKQNAVFTYTVPTQKIPLLDWTQMRASYTGRYQWVASSLLLRTLNQGNFLENGQDKTLNAELDFMRLYRKSKWLAALENEPQPKPKLDSASFKMKKLKKEIDKIKADSLQKEIKKLPPKERKLARKQMRLDKRNERKMREVEVRGLARAGGKILTMVKRASINVSEIANSRLPGYQDSTQFLGNNFKSNAPGFGYILGFQPDSMILNDFARRGLITNDPRFNQLFTQRYDQRFALQAQLEPVREMMIDVNMDKTFGKGYSVLFKDTTGSSGFNHLNPFTTGAFSVTYISFKTLFRPFNPDQTSETFKQFEGYRQQMSLRVAKTNPYWVNAGSPIAADGFAEGYNRYAQDVVIPSFIAAYTGKDPDVVPLISNGNTNIRTNPFAGFKPMPNWKLNYTGLSRIPALEKKFTAIAITHGYQGRLSMNQFNSALLFQDPFGLSSPGFIDTVSGNFIPYFLLPNITISEGFEPLFGIDVTTIGQLNIRAEYRKSRTLSMSMLDYQLSEMLSTDFMVGLSWRKRGMKVPFKLPKLFSPDGGNVLENDITFRFDFGIRDDAMSNSRLDQNSSFSTGGQRVIKINPSIDYVMNNRINIRLFLDQMRSIPYISTSAPTTNTRAGMQMRISLAN
jgi:cell surface protein SprA